MKAAQLITTKSPLRVEEVKLDPIGDFQVAIRTHFAGVNFNELMIADGVYPSMPNLPATLGGELSGEVIGVGKKVRGFQRGDRVFSFAQTGRGTSGSYAEVAHVDERYVYRLPSDVSFESGASLPMIGFTAYMLLTRRVTPQNDDVVLIHSAAGGVGSMLVYFTNKLFPKTTIIATCSDKRKEKIIQSLGASHVIDAHRIPWEKEINNKFPGGINIIFDPIGQKYFDAHLSLLKPLDGVLCSYGSYTGAITDQNVVGKLRRHNVALTGFLIWPLLEQKNDCEKILHNVFREVKGKKMPLIDRIFDLVDVNKAHERIRERKNIGKVLLRCGPRL